MKNDDVHMFKCVIFDRIRKEDWCLAPPRRFTPPYNIHFGLKRHNACRPKAALNIRPLARITIFTFSAYVPFGLSPSGERIYIPRALYAQRSICPRLYMPKVLCAHGSICPGFFMPWVLYTHSSICPHLYMPQAKNSGHIGPWAYRTQGI